VREGNCRGMREVNKEVRGLQVSRMQVYRQSRQAVNPENSIEAVRWQVRETAQAEMQCEMQK